MPDPQFSIVMPVFNEEKRIVESLRRVRAYLSLKPLDWELIIVNDGSADGTNRLVGEWMSAHPEVRLRLMSSSENRGKGHAVRRGMLAARGARVLLTDADLSAPIKEMDKLLAALDEGSDVAAGSRALREKDCDVRQSLRRKVAGRVFNLFVKIFVLRGIRDTQCGFKCFTREAAQKLFSMQTLQGFAFDVEILYLAKRNDLKVREVPVMWSENADSKISFFRDSFAMMGELLRIKKNH